MKRKSTAKAAARARRRVTGWDCQVMVQQAASGEHTRVQVKRRIMLPEPKNNKRPIGATASKAAKMFFRGLDRPVVAQVLSGLGHPVRLAVLQKLLEGAATYQALSQATGLRGGPLYHHVATLRLAGLIAAAKARDSYELTEAGRRLTVLTAAIPNLIRKK